VDEVCCVVAQPQTKLANARINKQTKLARNVFMQTMRNRYCVDHLRPTSAFLIMWGQIMAASAI
jgi:hypothetical protein